MGGRLSHVLAGACNNIECLASKHRYAGVTIDSINITVLPSHTV